MLLNVEHLYKYFNGQALLKDINFTVEDREAVGLIGINGCGKSTLLNIITGSEGYDKTPEGLGSVNIAGKASIGFLRQNSGLNSELTIGEEMKNAFAPLLETLDKMKVLEKKMASLPFQAVKKHVLHWLSFFLKSLNCLYLTSLPTTLILKRSCG